MGDIQQLPVPLSRGIKSKNNEKICYFKVYPPLKLKLMSLIFNLNHIKSLDWSCKNICEFTSL